MLLVSCAGDPPSLLFLGRRDVSAGAAARGGSSLVLERPQGLCRHQKAFAASSQGLEDTSPSAYKLMGLVCVLRQKPFIKA